MNQPVPGRAGKFSTSLPWQKQPIWRAHYQVAAASVDVTDLLNSDFELIELVERAITHLGIQSMAKPVGDRLSYAEQILTLVLDLQTDRVITLIGRLIGRVSATSESAQTMSMPVAGAEFITEAERTLRAQCAELNRLENLAQPCDYAMLRTGGRDKYSGMRISQLINMIPTAIWLEAQIRLRAAGSLTPAMEIKVARWIARGLDVHHAIEKVKWDARSRRRQ